jgi:hypothetical protein
MAYSSNPAQAYDANTTRTQSRIQVEPDVYDLDDPYLIPRLLSQGPIVAGPITCRFTAIPLNEPDAFYRNIAQYGHVVLESRDKLIIKVAEQNLDLLDRIRQVWVSKYVTPFAECRITFDLPRQAPEHPTATVIIQRVPPPMMNKGRAESPESEDEGARASDPSVAGASETTAFSVGRGEDEPGRILRVRE